MTQCKRFILNLIPDFLHQKMKGFYTLGYIPKLKYPLTFNEHILNRKLYLDNSNYIKYVDRLKVREYVRERSERINLISLIWYGKNLTKQVWDKLPLEFVIKANHGSGFVKIVNKKRNSYEEISNLTTRWLKNDFYKIQREYIYDQVSKVLLIEEKIQQNGKVPPDFKFFCFKGKVKFFQVDYSRFEEHRRNLYDVNFRKIPVKLYYPDQDKFEVEENYKNALEIAEELTREIDFMRVDLYIMGDKVYFGEMTMYPGAGFEPFKPMKYDLKFGKYFNN